MVGLRAKVQEMDNEVQRLRKALEAEKKQRADMEARGKEREGQFEQMRGGSEQEIGRLRSVCKQLEQELENMRVSLFLGCCENF